MAADGSRIACRGWARHEALYGLGYFFYCFSSIYASATCLKLFRPPGISFFSSDALAKNYLFESISIDIFNKVFTLTESNSNSTAT